MTPLQNKYFFEILTEHVDSLWNKTNKVPAAIYVSLPVFRSLIVEMGHATVYDDPIVNTNIPRRLHLNTAGGRTLILLDINTPEGLDFYCSEEEKSIWLDKLAEDILLKGES